MHSSPTAALTLAILFGMLLPASPGIAGKLDQVRDATGGGSRGDPEGGEEDGEEDEELVEWSERPWSGALSARLPEVYFLPWPYAGGRRGRLFDFQALQQEFPESVMRTPDGVVAYGQASAALAQVPDLASWSARLEADYAIDLDRVHRPAFALTLESICGLGLGARWTHYLEPLPGGALDQLGIGDVQVTYRVFQGPLAEVRLGLGARVMADDGATLGFSATGAIDLFPVDPLVLSAALDVGNLGRAFYGRGQVSLGIALARLEPYLGYDAVWIAGPDARVLFQGPRAGVRLWF